MSHYPLRLDIRLVGMGVLCGEASKYCSYDPYHRHALFCPYDFYGMVDYHDLVDYYDYYDFRLYTVVLVCRSYSASFAVLHLCVAAQFVVLCALSCVVFLSQGIGSMPWCGVHVLCWRYARGRLSLR